MLHTYLYFLVYQLGAQFVPNPSASKPSQNKSGGEFHNNDHTHANAIPKHTVLYYHGAATIRIQIAELKLNLSRNSFKHKMLLMFKTLKFFHPINIVGIESKTI